MQDEARLPAVRILAHDFLLLWPWLWPDNLGVWTWPRFSEDVLACQKWTFQFRSFKN